jgi:multidrug efflux pump
VRLKDIATIALGPESSDSSVYVNGERAIFVGIKTTPTANPLTVINDVRAMLPKLEKGLPPGMTLTIAYDQTTFIRAAIEEVVRTILEASVIVMVVIFFFMGSLRSVLIPLVTIPLSMVGVCLFLLALGFSINLLTLLAMVLAIGLVVDDAIVVVENVHRHIEEGRSPFEAAIIGTREIATPVISMTITLAAVYSPIAFQGGLTGALFREFALTLAGAVIISGIIALTLSPMMCSKVLRHDSNRRGLSAFIDRVFERSQQIYLRLLNASLKDRLATVVFTFIVLGSLYFLLINIARELAPDEDQGAAFLAYQGPSNANIDYMDRYSSELKSRFGDIKELDGFFAINGLQGVNQGFGVAVLKPWADRKRKQSEIIPEMAAKVGMVPGLMGSVMPIQFQITTTADYKSLNEVAQRFREKVNASGMFIYSDLDLKYEKPQTVVEIDRDKAGTYGVKMDAIAQTLALMTGGNYVNLMNLYNRSYEVIPQVARVDRLDPEQLGRQYYVKTDDGRAVPLSSLVTLREDVQPVNLNQFNQQNSAQLQGVPMPGISVGTVLDFLQKTAQEILPEGFTYDYAGQSRQYIQESNALYGTLGFAIAIIFLVLAAQFESFRDPLVIMISVPLSMCGALIPLALGVTTMNIYSQVGLITLVGLITKHGILICEVAKEQQRDYGHSKLHAVSVAAGLRLRPILMTTAAMVTGLIPLMFATGAGAASRFSIAVVIVAGMTVGTLFTLFVLPVLYTFIASDHRPKTASATGNEPELPLPSGETLPEHH